MGLLDRFQQIKIPAFSVSVYGKLPCHKEYFIVSLDAAFSELRATLNRRLDRFLKTRPERPYVVPDRRFYVREKGWKTVLAGCIFESDDGLRGFPFVLAVSLPARFGQMKFPDLWQALECIWSYLEAYFEDLRRQEDSAAVYARVRGVSHQLEPFRARKWQPLPGATSWRGARLLELALADCGDEDPPRPLQSVVLDAEPAFILWPVARWRDQGTAATGYLGARGLADFTMDLLGGSPGENTAGENIAGEDTASEDIASEEETTQEREDSLSDSVIRRRRLTVAEVAAAQRDMLSERRRFMPLPGLGREPSAEAPASPKKAEKKAVAAEVAPAAPDAVAQPLPATFDPDLPVNEDPPGDSPEPGETAAADESLGPVAPVPSTATAEHAEASKSVAPIEAGESVVPVAAAEPPPVGDVQAAASAEPEVTDDAADFPLEMEPTPELLAQISAEMPEQEPAAVAAVPRLVETAAAEAVPVAPEDAGEPEVEPTPELLDSLLAENGEAGKTQ